MKLVRLIIPFLLIVIICIISYNTYNNAKSVSNNPLSVIPNNSALIIKVNKPSKLFSYFENKKIWDKISNIFNSSNLNNDLRLIQKTFNDLNITKSNSLFITLMKDGITSKGVLISYEANENDFLKIKSSFNLSQSEMFSYDNTEMFYLNNDSLNIYFSYVNKIFQYCHSFYFVIS